MLHHDWESDRHLTKCLFFSVIGVTSVPLARPDRRSAGSGSSRATPSPIPSSSTCSCHSPGPRVPQSPSDSSWTFCSSSSTSPGPRAPSCWGWVEASQSVWCGGGNRLLWVSLSCFRLTVIQGYNWFVEPSALLHPSLQHIIESLGFTVDLFTVVTRER